MHSPTPSQAAEPMRAWAGRHGLAFSERGLLPAGGGVLSAGLGVGDRRAGFLVADTAHSFTATGGFTRRPERETHNLCMGVLPGGVEGVVAHHVHLEFRSRGESSQWVAAPSTVLLARLPGAARVVDELRGGPWSPPMKVGLTLDLSRGRAAAAPQPSRLERHDWRWIAMPARDEATLDALLGAGLGGALALAPDELQLTLRDGVLQLWVPGLRVEDDALEALCGVAAAFAAGARAAAEHVPAAAADRPLAGSEAPAPDAPWFASVAEATEPHARAAAPEARRVRRITWAAAGVSSLLFLVVIAALEAALLFAFRAPAAVIAVVAVLGTVVMLPGLLRGVVAVGRLAARDRTASDAVPAGRAAFLRGYAARHGLAVEDAGALRRALEPPLPGAAVGSLAGEIAPGVRGRLLLWRDRDDDAAPRRRLVALVAAPDGATRTVVRDVGDGDPWTAAELDALRAGVPGSARATAEA